MDKEIQTAYKCFLSLKKIKICYECYKKNYLAKDKNIYECFCGNKKAILKKNILKNYINRICYCGNKKCEWDCGVLVCGCIDMCRGRCGCKPWEDWDF